MTKIRVISTAFLVFALSSCLQSTEPFILEGDAIPFDNSFECKNLLNPDIDEKFSMTKSGEETNGISYFDAGGNLNRFIKISDNYYVGQEFSDSSQKFVYNYYQYSEEGLVVSLADTSDHSAEIKDLAKSYGVVIGNESDSAVYTIQPPLEPALNFLKSIKPEMLSAMLKCKPSQ